MQTPIITGSEIGCTGLVGFACYTYDILRVLYERLARRLNAD